MKKLIILVLFAFLTVNLKAQLTVVSTTPANNSKNVSTNTTVSITFNKPIERDSVRFHEGDFLVTNLFRWVDNIGEDSIRFSNDSKTITFLTPLKPDKDYFILLYGLYANDGTKLQEPVLIRFTTAPDFNGVTVSGTVSADCEFQPVKNTFVFLIDNTLEERVSIDFCAIADSNGNYSIPYVTNGTYYVLAIRDNNYDGKLDDESGDLFSLYPDSISVSNSDVSSINLTFQCYSSFLTFERAKAIADSIYTHNLNFVGYSLKAVIGIDILYSHYPNEWQFCYASSLLHNQITIDIYDNNINVFTDDDSIFCDSSKLPDLDDNVETLQPFLNNVFSHDLSVYKHTVPPENCILFDYVILGKLGNKFSKVFDFTDMTSDKNKTYWGAEFMIVDTTQIDPVHFFKRTRFLGDVNTGDLISVTKVKDVAENSLPANFKLYQNYPNPVSKKSGDFTTIRFSLPASVVSNSANVKLEVYDLLGRKISTLVNKELSPGIFEVKFNTGNLPSGIYFYKLSLGNRTLTRKMIILK